MTDATTADILVTGELLQAHAPCLLREDGIWVCSDGRRGTGDTWHAAVKAWAEAAGVPWPSVKVVPMWALDGAIGMHVDDSRILAEEAAHRNNCRVIPCEVVIRETEGV